MNLHAFVSPLIGVINPMIPITVQQSTGYAVDANYNQVPSYTALNATGQVQPLSASDTRKLEGMNIQGVTQSVYLNGNFEGVFRVLGKGGDLLVFNGYTYLVNAVLERWPDWCKVGVTMQLDSTP